MRLPTPMCAMPASWASEPASRLGCSCASWPASIGATMRLPTIACVDDDDVVVVLVATIMRFPTAIVDEKDDDSCEDDGPAVPDDLDDEAFGPPSDSGLPDVDVAVVPHPT